MKAPRSVARRPHTTHPSSQALLAPILVTVGEDEADLAERQAGTLRAAGLQVFWLNRDDKAWDSDEPAPPMASTLHGLLRWLGH